MEYEATEKAYKQVPIGTHTAICYMIADIGTQETEFEGIKKMTHQIILGWETPDEKTEQGKPLSIIKTYTLPQPDGWTNEKASLPKDYKAWTKEANPSTFNLSKLLGTGCNINVGVTSGGKAKVIGVSALKANEKVPNLVAEPVLFDLRAPDDNALSRLPGFIKDKIAASPEYQAHVLKIPGSGVAPELNDEIPF